jgi:hypothetical protein
VTATFVMYRFNNKAFDNTPGKWKMTTTTAVEKAASHWGFTPFTGDAGGEVSGSLAVLIQE